MSSIMRCRSGLMALSVMRDAPVLMKVVNPSSQDRTPRHAIVLAPSPAAPNYRASGLVLWRKADTRETQHRHEQADEVQIQRQRPSPPDEARSGRRRLGEIVGDNLHDGRHRRR